MGMMMNPIDIGENPCNIAHFIAQNVVHLSYFDLVSAIEGKFFNWSLNFRLAHNIYEGIQMIPIEIGHDLNDIALFFFARYCAIIIFYLISQLVINRFA